MSDESNRLTHEEIRDRVVELLAKVQPRRGPGLLSVVELLMFDELVRPGQSLSFVRRFFRTSRMEELEAFAHLLSLFHALPPDRGHRALQSAACLVAGC
jgi:hypothetical protein